VISIGVAGECASSACASRRGEAGNVLQLVLRQGVWLAGAGIVIGLLGATWVVRFLRSLLFGVSAFDLPTFMAATVVLVLVAIVACLIRPAGRLGSRRLLCCVSDSGPCIHDRLPYMISPRRTQRTRRADALGSPL
jgi:hypothetical protein